MASKAKKKNIFVDYFTPFGLKQACDLLMIAGFIVLFVGLFTSVVVIIVGVSIYIAACAIALYRSIRILLTTTNKRAPEYKSAIINIVIMGVLFALAITALVLSVASPYQ